MRRFMTAVLVLGAVLALAAGVWLGMDARAKKTLGDERMRWRADVAKEVATAGALRMPVPYGTARDANAAEEEWPLIRAVAGQAALDRKKLEKAADPSPGVALSPEARALLDAGRGHLAELERALTATGCDWEIDYEDALDQEVPPYTGARRLSLLCVLAGHERAAAGDPAEAARWYLRAVRLGADLGQGGLLPAMIGTKVAADGLRAVGRLLAAPPAGSAPPLDEVEAALRALAPLLPNPAVALWRERLGAKGICFETAKRGNIKGLLTFGSSSRSLLRLARTVLVPAKRTVARALPEIDATFDAAAAAVAATSRSEQQRRLAAVTHRIATSQNPVVSALLVGLSRTVPKLEESGVRLALCRLAVILERRRQEDGRYPQALGEADRPVDRLARPARLHYEPSPDGRTYRIWSAGENGKDERGRSKDPADDLALEGRAP